MGRVIDNYQKTLFIKNIPLLGHHKYSLYFIMIESCQYYVGIDKESPLKAGISNLRRLLLRNRKPPTFSLDEKINGKDSNVSNGIQ